MEQIKEYRFCKVCGSRNSGSPSEAVWRCTVCSADNDKNKPMLTYTSEEVSLSTHVQFRVACRVCGHRSIVWTKKDDNVEACPKCGSPTGLFRNRLKSRGEFVSMTVWGTDPVGISAAPRPERHYTRCPHCNTSNGYLMTIPKLCIKCKKPMTSESAVEEQ